MNNTKLEAEEAGVSPRNLIILNDFQKTKEFLNKNLGEINKETIQGALEDRKMAHWVAKGQVSPFYVLLCPYIDLGDRINIYFGRDFSIYKITEEVKNLYQEIFSD